MLFRSRIVSSITQTTEANEAKEGITESKRMVSERIVSSIKSDFNNALKYYEKHKKLLNSVTDRWYKDPAIVFMQRFSTIENLSLEELSELLCILAKLQSKIECVQTTIVQLQKAVEKSIEWSRDGILPTIGKLIEINRNLQESVIYLVVHREHSKELQQAINHMHNDARITECKKAHEYAMEKYWNEDIHWQEIFAKPAFSYLITYAISIMSNLEDMTTRENCNLIYAMHKKGNEPSIYELSKRLTGLLDYDKNKRNELNFKTAPFINFGHKIDLTERLSSIFFDIRPTVSEYKPPAEAPVDVALVVMPSAPSPPAYDEDVVRQEGELDLQASEATVSPVSKKGELNVSVQALQQQGKFRRTPENNEPLIERKVVALAVN